MRRFTTVLSIALSSVLVLAAAACGDDADTTTTGTTAAPTTTTTAAAAITNADADDPLVSCPTGPAFPLSAVDDVAPVEEAPDGVVDAMRSFLDDEEGAFWPQEGWRILHETEDHLLLVQVGDGSTAASTGLSFMSIAATDDGWAWDGASSRGDCPLRFQLADGLGVVEWELDPAHPEPGPTDTSVQVLATERACASAQPMDDRLNDPVVLADASQVSITFSVIPLDGDQECPGNPATAVEVDLGEPLGERRLVDGRDVGVELEDLLNNR